MNNAHGTASRPDPSWVRSGRVASLDGLRGVSILLVLIHHVALQSGADRAGLLFRASEFGRLGVDVFFVISGFLITLLLVRERRATGRTALGAFYLRRTLRIVPAYVAYLVIAGATLALLGHPLSRTDWLRAATYTTSIFGSNSWYVGHSWSLSVEEHFYLLWPLLFVALPRRLALVACVGYTGLAVVGRVAYDKLGGIAGTHVDYFSPLRGDAIAAGCALALLATSRARGLLQRAGPGTAWAAAAVALAMLVAAEAFRHAGGAWPRRFEMYGFRFVTDWCIVVVLWAAVYHPAHFAGRLLNWPPLTAVGVLSYSLYLWQELFVGPLQAHWPFRLPWNLAATLVAAYLSYLLVERPFLRLKSRFEPTREAAARSDAEAARLATATEPAAAEWSDAEPTASRAGASR